jgi:hypothetical protein
MLGEIFGIRAGEIWADEVLCLFLVVRGPDFNSDLLCPPVGSGDISGLMTEVRGVLFAVNFGVFAESVGVS